MMMILTDQQVYNCFEGAKIVKIFPDLGGLISFTNIGVLLEDGKRLEFSGWPKLQHVSCNYADKTWREALKQPIHHIEILKNSFDYGNAHRTQHTFVLEDGHNVIFCWEFISPRKRHTQILLKDYRFYDDD